MDPKTILVATMEAVKLRNLFLVFVVLTVLTVTAHIADFDEVWQSRAEEAKTAARQAYHPDPEKVINHFNKHVHKVTQGDNSTRRELHNQGNRFIAPPNPAAKEVTKRDYAPESVWKSWLWRSEGDLMMDGAFFTQSGNSGQSYSKRDLITPKPGSYVPRLTRFSGSMNCVPNSPC
ncbi:pectin lyase-like superfamily protein [Actinidia rufa]|uniref:Pectin lyase-like superfamily protein n=1 Tax=Actinidia rufa TaxID=165716 RepID=A0A7J0FY64_9ERIC|nr:pectin lyase-like superfamily protein [Actinidia rufa]